MTIPNHFAIHPAFWLPDYDLDLARQRAARAAEIGFDRLVVPLGDPTSRPVTDISNALAAAGIRPVNTTSMGSDEDPSSLDAEVRSRGCTRLRTAIHRARDMGSDHLGGVLYGPLKAADGVATEDQWNAAVESLATMADEAKTAGVRLVLEVVNRYETNLLNTAATAVQFIHATRADNLYLHLDTYHMNIDERDFVEAIQTGLPYLVYLELGQNHRGILSEGHIPLRMILAAALNAGFNGTVGVEAFSRQLLPQSVANKLAVWRSLFADWELLATEAYQLIDSTINAGNEVSG